MRRVWSLLVAFDFLLCVPAGATARAGEQPYIRIGSYGRLITDVYINGQGPLSTFLIDTASSCSLIFEHVLKQA